MRNSLKVIAVALAVALFAAFGAGQAAAQRVAPGPLPQNTFDAAPQVYEVIAGVPKELEADEQKAKEWIATEFDKRGWTCRTCYGPLPVQPRADVGKCLAGIAAAIASNVLAIGKALKVMKLVRDLGGAKKVVGLINEGFKRSKDRNMDAFKAISEVFEEAGTGLGAIAAELLAIDGILDNCF